MPSLYLLMQLVGIRMAKRCGLPQMLSRAQLVTLGQQPLGPIESVGCALLLLRNLA
jgi:hypothetical protein